MRVWEAHIWLANALGDSIIVESSNGYLIPDGVRYSKLLRDSYLYRAMLEIYRSTLEKVSMLPKQHISQILYSAFPNVITKEEGITVTATQLQMDIFSKVPLYVIAIEALDTDGNLYPIPMRDYYKGVYLRNSRNVQRYDAFCTLIKFDGTTSLNYYDNSGLTCDMTVTYLPYPTNPSTQETTDDLDFEEKYLQSVLVRALTYGLTDSQDIQNQEVFLRVNTEQNNANN
jgi:hypothetical protein